MGPSGGQPNNQNKNPLSFQVGNNMKMKEAVMNPNQTSLAKKLGGDSLLPQTMTNQVTPDTMVSNGKGGGKSGVGQGMNNKAQMRNYLQ